METELYESLKAGDVLEITYDGTIGYEGARPVRVVVARRSKPRKKSWWESAVTLKREGYTGKVHANFNRLRLYKSARGVSLALGDMAVVLTSVKKVS